MIKNFSSGAVTHPNKSAIKSEIILKQQLAEELHMPVIRKFGQQKQTHVLRQYFLCWSWRYGVHK